MYCSDCGNSIKPLAKFCDNCGLKIKVKSKSSIIEPSQISWASNISTFDHKHHERANNSRDHSKVDRKPTHTCEHCGRTLRYLKEYEDLWCNCCQRFVSEPY